MKFKPVFDFSIKLNYIVIAIWVLVSFSFYLFLNTLFKSVILFWVLEYEISFELSHWKIYAPNFFIAFLSLMVGQFFAKLIFFGNNFRNKYRLMNDDFMIWYYLFWFLKITFMFLFGLFIDTLINDEKYNIIEELNLIAILSILFLFFYSYNSFIKFFKNSQKTVFFLFGFYLFIAALYSFVNPISLTNFQKNIIENNPINKYKIDLIKLPFKNNYSYNSNAFFISKTNENQIVVICQNEAYKLNELNLLYKTHYQDSNYLKEYSTPLLLITADFSMKDYRKLMTNLYAANFNKLNLGGKTYSNKYFEHINIYNHHYYPLEIDNYPTPTPPPPSYLQESENYTMKITLLNENYLCIDNDKIAIHLFNDYIITHLKTKEKPFFLIEINEKINYGTYLLTLSYLKQAHDNFVISKLPNDSFYRNYDITKEKYPLKFKEKFNF